MWVVPSLMRGIWQLPIRKSLRAMGYRVVWNQRSPLAYAWGFMAAALVTTVMVPFRDRLDILNVMLIYLLVSFGSALLLGAGPAALGVVISFLAFDFFSIP